MTNKNGGDLMVEIQSLLDKVHPPRPGKCYICEVPSQIRTLNPLAYTPKVVSIGPLYHLDPKLKYMETHKLASFKEFVKRVGSLKILLDFVQEIETEVRLCYSETLNLSQNEFCKMILVDASFIIELFLTSYYREAGTVNDLILFAPWLDTNVRLDLVLFENQLPFFAIEKLFNLVFLPGERTDVKYPSFFKLSFDYFKYYNKQDLKFEDLHRTFASDVKIMHFTDLLRYFHLQLQTLEKHNGREDEPVEHLPSATELRESGVKFKTSKSQCLQDMKFSKGVLKIPQIKVDDWTETLFRNMMALEQFQYPYESYITDFVAVMDFLINTSQDVDFLVQKGIVLNWLGDSNAVANLFNGLWKNVTHSGFNRDYYRVCVRLNNFYRSPRNKWKASLRRNYCKTPWMTLATTAAIALLILAIIQTICSVLQVT